MNSSISISITYVSRKAFRNRLSDPETHPSLLPLRISMTI